MKQINYIISLCSLLFLFSLCCCNSHNSENSGSMVDSTTLMPKSTDVQALKTDSGSSGNIKENGSRKVAEKAIVLVYNFHVTNRCASCIAIEEATKKTLNLYFASELKQGRIKVNVLNVDDNANAAISEKYQVFGSGLIITRLLNGKETTADLTAEGFKYARSKEEKFIEILKNKISEFLN